MDAKANCFLITDWGRGWGCYPLVVCIACGYSCSAVTPIGSKGKECPSCGYYDPEFVWYGDGTMPGDGVWMSGQYHLVGGER